MQDQGSAGPPPCAAQLQHLHQVELSARPSPRNHLFRRTMKPEERDLLQRYFPAASVEQVGALYELRRFVLHFKRPRSSKLGDFRPPRSKTSICHITLNCDLNPFQMLITYIHEVAHYDVYQQYGSRRVQPHGKEWQARFTTLLQPFMTSSIFPDDVLEALQNHLQHIKASSTADPEPATGVSPIRQERRNGHHGGKPARRRAFRVEKRPRFPQRREAAHAL